VVRRPRGVGFKASLCEQVVELVNGQARRPSLLNARRAQLARRRGWRPTNPTNAQRHESEVVCIGG
jgi:hypothetical protein